MSFSRNEIVLLPIPFSDLTSRKVRPAVIVGHGRHAGDLFVVPISSVIPLGSGHREPLGDADVLVVKQMILLNRELYQLMVKSLPKWVTRLALTIPSIMEAKH